VSIPLKTHRDSGKAGAARWYQAGIRFQCTGSARCCKVHGDYAYVFLTHEEERRLASHLDVSLREFRRRHTFRPGPGERSLRFPAGCCTFLAEGKCSVYAVRPRQCRTWPFWEENLEPRVWKEEVAPFCPGIGRGRLYSAREIEAVQAGEMEVSAGCEDPAPADHPTS
jgi:Fe-S-cluster containining protein